MQFGHATITDVVTRLDASWATHPQGHLTTADAWYNPDVVLAAGLEPIIRGMIAQPQGQVEPRWSLAVASKFAGDPTANGESRGPAAARVGWWLDQVPCCILPHLALQVSTHCLLVQHTDCAYMSAMAAGTDVAALTIQRGRDVGIPDYNTCR